LKNFFFKLIGRIIRGIKSIYSITVYGIPYLTYRACYGNRSFDSMSSALLWMINVVKNEYPDFEIKHSTILEIGSGQFLSHPIALKILGAHQITSIDLFEQYNNKAAYLSLTNSGIARKVLSGSSLNKDTTEYISSIARQLKISKRLNIKGIKYLAPYDLMDNPFESTFDIVFSYTVLEHVPLKQIHPLLVSTIKSLKQGGVFFHYVDLEDHSCSNNNPFAFIDNRTWTDNDCQKRGNRIRIRDWEEIIKSLELTSSKIIPNNFRSSNIKFKNKTDQFCGFLFVGKK